MVLLTLELREWADGFWRRREPPLWRWKQRR